MEAMLIRPDDLIDNFKHTLQHLAREWYHGLDLTKFHGNWHEFTTHFSRYFSTQGRNIKHLHERWRTFSFDPSTDDIEEYIRDVREAAKQLGHGDDAVLNLLKATMPTELYGTLYSHDNLYTVMTMLKDIYAKKPQNNVAAAAGVAQGATAPFTHICSPTRGAPKAQSDASLEDRILQLTETLYRIDMNGKPPRKPFKPFITQPRRRFKPGRNGRDGHFNPSNGRSFQPNLQETDNKDSKDNSNSKDLLGSLTKVPTPNVPESLVDLLIKTKFAALDAKSLATCKKTVQNSTDHHKRTLQDLRSLRIIPTLTQDLMSNLPCQDTIQTNKWPQIMIKP